MKETIRELVLSLGAEVCGFAAVDRFCDAPAGFHPTDVFAQCKTVVVFGKALPKAVTKASPRIVYKHFNDLSLAELDRIAAKAALYIEQRTDGFALPVPCDGPYESWIAETMEGRGTVSMKHAAVLAGLGTLGKHTMLIHPRYGTLLNVGAVLTDLALPSDPLCEELCNPGCRKCTESCPVGAITEQGVNQLLCRQYAYGKNDRGFEVCNCNRCRTVCPKVFGTER